MTECNQCGDCCESIHLRYDIHETLRGVYGVADPRTDEGWAQWLEKGWKEDDRPIATGNWLTSQFVMDRWHKTSDNGNFRDFTCDAFDAATRLCTAHADRPPVCSMFPFYGGQIPNKSANMSMRCSYWADLPEADRPAEWVPLAIGATR